MKRPSTITLTTALMLLTATLSWAAEAGELGKQVLARYQAIQTALAGDSIAGVRAAAAEIADRAAAGDAALAGSEPAQALVAAARGMDGADLATLREQFKKLSGAMTAYLDVTGVATAQLYFCPMAQGYWLQPKADDEARNPYLGNAMSTCGIKAEQGGE